LEEYKSRIWLNPKKSFPEELQRMAQKPLNHVRARFNDKVISEQVGASLFWSALRKTMQDNTLLNKMANRQVLPDDDTKASDIFLKTLYASIEQVPVVYESVTPDGKKVMLSGKIFLPPKKRVKSIIVANHFTICSNREAPSHANCIEGILATKEYIVIMPDYVGYGVTANLPHPYLQLESAVTSSIDLLKAAIPYLRARLYVFPKPIILVGYSQGAAVTMAMQKKLEEEYADRFPVKQTYIGAGPYDLATTYDFYVSQPVTAIPCSLPMLIIGMSYGEHLDLKREDYFQPEMMENCPKLIDSKLLTLFEVNELLDHDIHKLLTPLIFSKDTYPTTLLYEAMKKNSIIDWTPKAPLYMFHSTEDDMVPFINSIKAANSFASQFLTNIEYEFAPYGHHILAAVTFFEKVYHRLK
jgi:pimeloyl-ACP methyl ester carboxylesterase